MLYSLIVPTKDRYPYLWYIINRFKGYYNNNLEIELVIQDNTRDNKDFYRKLLELNSDNIVYHHNPNTLSVSQNFSEALDYAKGEYVSFIGDDDGFSSYILDFVKYMKRNNIDSAIFNKAHYRWPDAIAAMPKKKLFEIGQHTLTIHKANGSISDIKTRDALNQVMTIGAVQLEKMPEAYHGVVRRKAFEKVKEITGSYYPGSSPDMANAVALCHEIDRHVYVDCPFLFSGQCVTSAGGHNLRKKHTGKLKDIPFLPNNIEDIWNPKIPKIWTVQTIYAETAMEVLNIYDDKNAIDSFNWECLYAHFFFFHREYRCMLKPYLTKVNSLKFFKHLVVLYIKLIGRYPMFILRNTLHPDRNEYHENVHDTNEAGNIIDKYISGLSLKYL